MADIVIDAGSVEIVSAIMRMSAEQLGLKAGDKVIAIVKSTASETHSQAKKNYGKGQKRRCRLRNQVQYKETLVT